MQILLRSALSVICLAALAACSDLPNAAARSIDIDSRIASLRAVDILLVGEQHDNPDHQRIHAQIIESLAAKDELTAVVIEMAEQGHATTGLTSSASEESVKNALRWNDKAWPWSAYAPPVMAAVRAGVPVLGGNLPRGQMRDAMGQSAWDARLRADALLAQQALIRSGHCNLLAEAQIAPMTRIQIARDVAMAEVLASAVRQAAYRGKTVVLLAGSGHVDKRLGVPRHLPDTVAASAILLSAQTSAAVHDNSFDQVWPSASAPEKDHCAELKRALGG